MDRRTRAWSLAAGLLVGSSPVLAATRVTIHDLKSSPERYYNQSISLECYYDKESPIWVRALPDAPEWIGFFVTGKPEQASTWRGQYYNLLFAPSHMREAVRSLRGGDKITVIGEGFRYLSASFDGVGIHVQQILRGWGPSAEALGGLTAPTLVPAASAASSVAVHDAAGEAGVTSESSEKVTVTINGKRYGGLRLGDRYNFDGIDFQVDKNH